MMQRVRIGLTGLALVFLLVMLGSVIRSFSSDDQGAVNSLTSISATDPSANDQEPTEPLAELGVAPGSTDSFNGTADSSKAANQ
jgi:hypothetical protein